MNHVARHLLRPATVRVLPAALPRRQDPDGPAAPGGARRRDRLLLPRQRPRLPRDPDHPAAPQDGRADPAQLRVHQPDPAQVFAALPQAVPARLARPHVAPVAGLCRPPLGGGVREHGRDERRRLLPGDVPPDGAARGHTGRALERPGLPACSLRRGRLLCRCPLRRRGRAGPPDGRGPETVQGRRQFRASGRDGVHQGAGQPDARHPAPLDAIGRAVHPLRGRGERTGLPAQGGRTGDHLRRP